MKRRILSVLLAAVMALSLLPVSAAAADDKWTDHATENWGSDDDYTIDSAEDLAAFAAAVNNGSFTGETVTLADNIDLSDHEWVPIGTQEHPFSGTFDGGGKTISHMSIVLSDSNLSAGLFGRISDGTVKDVILNQVSINGEVRSEDTTIYIGGIAAANSPKTQVTIENCKTDLNVEITTDAGVIVKAGGILGAVDGESGSYATLQKNIAALNMNHRAVSTYYRTYIGGAIGYISNSKNTTKIESCDLSLNLTATAEGVAGTSKSFSIGGAVGYMPSSGSSSNPPVIYLKETSCSSILDLTAAEGTLTSNSVLCNTNIGGFFGKACFSTIENSFAMIDLQAETENAYFANIAGNWNDTRDAVWKNVYTYAVQNDKQITKPVHTSASWVNATDVYYIVPNVLQVNKAAAPFTYVSLNEDAFTETEGINDGFQYSDGDTSDGITVTPSDDRKKVSVDQASDACLITGEMDNIHFTLPVEVRGADEAMDYQIIIEVEGGTASYPNGSITTEPENRAQGGTTVTVTAAPRVALFYVLDTISAYETDSKEPVELTKNSTGTMGTQTYTFTMPEADVTIHAVFRDTEARLEVSPPTIDFGTVAPGYTPPEAQTVVVKNTGEKEKQITLSTSSSSFNVTPIGDKWENFGPSTTTKKITLSPGDEVSFTVQPKEGLPVSQYSYTYSNHISTSNPSVRFTCQFRVQERQITGIAVTKQPKLNYTEGEALFLSALELTVTYNDGSSEIIKYDEPGVEFSIPHGTPLTITDHDGKAITVTYQGKTAQTDQLTVTAKQQPADPTPDPTPGGGNDDHDSDPYLKFNSNGGTEFDPIDGKGRDFSLNVYDDDEYGSHIPTRPGYRFTGWYRDRKLTMRVDEDETLRVRGAITLFAGWAETTVPDLLNGDAHYAYLQGYADGTIRPNASITRAQVATIFFRLLDEDIRDDYLTAGNPFPDVSEDYWASTAISTMAALGIVNGRSDGSFDPDASITRAEFAAICARFDEGGVSVASAFTDTSGHWAEAEIGRAAALGWIQGYSDGSFRPDQYITRAQAVTMINRMLCRQPETAQDLLPGMSTWTDCREGDWYYLAVQEAANSHGFVAKDRTYETWTSLDRAPDWSRYE